MKRNVCKHLEGGEDTDMQGFSHQSKVSTVNGRWRTAKTLEGVLQTYYKRHCRGIRSPRIIKANLNDRIQTVARKAIAFSLRMFAHSPTTTASNSLISTLRGLGLKCALINPIPFEQLGLRMPPGGKSALRLSRLFMSRRIASVVLVAFALVISSAPEAKADEIVFAGGSGGTVQVLGNILVPTFHQFTLDSAPLSVLQINGTAVPFSGSLNISATGTDSAPGELLFSAGTLTVSSLSNTEVTGQLLGAALGVDSSNNSVVFLGVLDPGSTVFSDLLDGEGPLLVGIGGTDFEVELPIIDLPTIGFQGTALNSGAILLTPEPSALLLLTVGLAFPIICKSRVQIDRRSQT